MHELSLQILLKQVRTSILLQASLIQAKSQEAQ